MFVAVVGFHKNFTLNIASISKRCVKKMRKEGPKLNCVAATSVDGPVGGSKSSSPPSAGSNLL